MNGYGVVVCLGASQQCQNSPMVVLEWKLLGIQNS